MRKQPEPIMASQAFDIERLSRYFSELSPQPMIAVEGTTHIVRYLNGAFSRLAGKDRAEMIGRDFAQAVPEGEENGCIALLDRVYHTGAPEVLAEQQHSHTPPGYWTYSVWPILGPDLHPIGAIVQVTDATEIAVFRKQLVGLNEHLLLSAIRQHELTETAENANHLKDEFLATLSHELRTPLTVIIGWADMLKDPRFNAIHWTNAIDVIRRNARMQVQMVDDLLDVSRIITGKLRLSLRPLDLHAVVAAAVDGLRPAAEAKAIDLQLQLEPSLGQVAGDPDRLQQVMWNLVFNAIKFTPQGGHVLVSLNHIDSQVEFAVSDSGEGISPGFLPHVFDRFRQADATTTRTFGGLGLGLSIVRQLVELHGGTVRVQSEGKDRGATFTVSLPLMPAGSADDIEYSMPPPSLPELECLPELEGLRVLVVDDEEDTREMLQVILEGCGAHVQMAGSVREALAAVADEEFDVLISDIGLPEENGYSLLARVHALSRERGGKVPVAAALTAYASEEDRIRALHSGFQIHVPKPISPRELIAVVANLAGHTSEIHA